MTAHTDSTSTPWRTSIAAIPVLVGVASGIAMTQGGVSAESSAIPAGIATLAYLAAGALGSRWTAWAAVASGTALVVLGELLGATWWHLIAAAGTVLVVVGVARRQRATALEAAGMVGYFGIAVAALFLSPTLGLGLAALTLIAHAAWDAYHLTRDRVVPRSLALWCIGLDVTVGIVCLWFALTGLG